jgi:hypothetical protein
MIPSQDFDEFRCVVDGKEQTSPGGNCQNPGRPWMDGDHMKHEKLGFTLW